MALTTLDWSDVLNEVDINKAVEVFEVKIRAVMNKFTPQKSVRMSSPVWMSPLVKCLLRTKSHISLNNKERLSLFNKCISELITENRRKLAAIGSSEWWKGVDALSQRRSSLLINLDKNSLVCLNDYFANLCYDDIYIRPIDMDILDSVKPPKISERCVWNTLVHVKKTATGPDDLPYWIWKDCAELLTPIITHVWNLSLSTHTWPDSWNRANVNPLPKVNMPIEDSDYRGINVTPVIARLFKKVVYRTQAQSVIENNLSHSQFACRQAGSCTNTLLAIQHQTYKYLDSSDCSTVRIFTMDFRQWKSVNRGTTQGSKKEIWIQTLYPPQESQVWCKVEDSGYTSFKFYTDMEFVSPVAQKLSLSERAIVDFLQSLLQKGYHLYTDNWYTSVQLHKYLHHQGTLACGTIQSNRKGFPEQTRQKAPQSAPDKANLNYYDKYMGGVDYIYQLQKPYENQMVPHPGKSVAMKSGSRPALRRSDDIDIRLDDHHLKDVSTVKYLVNQKALQMSYNARSIGIDGSSDTDVEETNLATVRIFDVERAKTVTSHFYQMCVTSGRDASKSGKPSIHIVYHSIMKLANTLRNRVIKVEVMKKALNEINLQDPTIYLPLSSIHLGGMTKFTLQRLLNQGEISPTAYTHFLTAAQEYFKAAFQYVLSKSPITDELLKHATWINVQKLSQAKWESVECFLSRFQSALNTVNIDKMYDEFHNYRSLTDDDIGMIAWKEARVVDGLVNDQKIFFYRVDIMWWYISQMVIPESSAIRFCHLQKVAELVVLLPHSNAG
ncbi:hypothetical protein AWC38_SpisGene13665 [Stylophora pistillata]|uniref:PiggyBac transposable element-derived protein domain-containing protein n=1 Tax=Stylophora pistillata TaxID=50429 RepID=A0A2B4RYF3_STYPI|nr:hypothetical protein AWC38_SpisGene13665 [Stylophora pistillata]